MLLSCGRRRGRWLKESDPVTPVEETGSGDEDEGNRREPGLAEDLREDRHEDAAEGERKAGSKVPAGEKETADQGEAAEDCPKRQASNRGNRNGATLAGGCRDFDLVPFPSKRDMGGRLGIGGLERGHGGRWKAVCIVQSDGGMAWRRGRGHAAAEGGGEEEEKERRFHATSVEVASSPGEPEN